MITHGGGPDLSLELWKLYQLQENHEYIETTAISIALDLHRLKVTKKNMWYSDMCNFAR